MSVYTVEYSRKNPETKRNITVVKYRAQVKHNGKAHTKLFDTEREAKDWEAQKEKELSGMATVESMIAEANKITMRMLLAEHFKQHLSKQSPNSYKTNQNRSLRAIPEFKIPYELIHKRISPQAFIVEGCRSLMASTEQLFRIGEKNLSLQCQALRHCCAVNQPGLQRLLQPLDMLRYCWLGQSSLLRRFAKAPAFDDGNERRHTLQIYHAAFTPGYG